MKSFFSLQEIADARSPDLPASASGLKRLAARWRKEEGKTQTVSGKTKPVLLYHISLLPLAAQTRLALMHATPANDDRDQVEAERARLWARYEALSKRQKEVCEARLKAVIASVERIAAGQSTSAAVETVARAHGISARSLLRYRAMINGVERSDWRAALAANHDKPSEFAPCDDAAWTAIKSDYLRPESPTFSACYRRLLKAARKEGWSPIPSERALRRRLDAEVAKPVQTLARAGKDAAKAIYPAQRRTRTHLHAMQAVNMDGHKLDVFVRLADGKVTRMLLVALQDLYSGKFVAWRLAETENKEAVRLVIGDMVERHGIPEKIYLDNGRAFASKWITGGAPNRFRFKVRDEDPQGLLVTLGVEIVWTKPYSGQSKPIERAFSDLTDSIARHPLCAGAYTGNKPDAKPENYASRAIDLDAFRAHVDGQIAAHNAQAGRTAETCKGRSFDETFNDSLAEPSSLIRWASPAQRALWLLAADNIRTKKGSGEIHLHGNRYWAQALNQHAGRTVTIRFDPEQLHRDLKVYDINGSWICDAACIADTGFDDVSAARTHNRKRADLMRSIADQKRLHAELSADQLAALYADDNPAAAQQPSRPPKVARIATGNLAVDFNASRAVGWDDQAEEDFSKGLRLFAGADDNVIEFTPMSSEYGDNQQKKSGGYEARRKK